MAPSALLPNRNKPRKRPAATILARNNLLSTMGSGERTKRSSRSGKEQVPGKDAHRSDRHKRIQHIKIVVAHLRPEGPRRGAWYRGNKNRATTIPGRAIA